MIGFPELVVVAGYFVAALFVYTRASDIFDAVTEPLPVIDSLNSAGLVIVASSFYYHYAVISPANGVQNLFLLMTQIVGISVVSVLVGRKLLPELIG